MGDRILKSLADVLINRFRKVDTVARFGSDEFVVLLDEIQDGSFPHQGGGKNHGGTENAH